MLRKIIPAFLVLALAVMACSFNINIPVNSVTPGPIVTDQINVPLPAGASDHVDLNLTFGAGTLKLHPGSSEVVSGTATYNIADFKPTVTAAGSNVSIEQGNWKMNGIPTNFSNYKNEWDLSLGTTPLNLDIQAGAYHAEYEFGGLALTGLTVKDGAADTKLDFDSPNAATMSLLRYETGASNVSLTGLGNANFSSLEFDCGAGNYTLDFSGVLKQAGNVHVKTGISNMTLVIPTGVSAQVTVTGGLSNVSHDSAWSKSGNVYTQSGSGPQLTISVEIGAGNLTLTH
jgi:hypothetical protein